MKSQLVILAVILVVASAFQYSDFSSELVQSVNKNKHSTWKATQNSRFDGMTFSEIQHMMGVLETPAHLVPRTNYYSESLIERLGLPENYDLRTQFPNCQSIQEVRDQSNCGSCWAFGTVEAISDRICISSNQQDQTRISATNLLSCCKGVLACGMGCNGGYPAAAWSYYVKTGIVTGDLYTNEKMTSSQFCQPYSFPPCSHHVDGEYQACTDLPEYSTPSCENKCNSSYTSNSYADDIHQGDSHYSVPSSVSQIQAEIYQYGSVTGAFSVYADFLTYSSGVYQHTTGSYMGGHAIKIIGWGVENGTPYWQCTNSWNNSWGENGFFKILRGSNECGIESSIVAGLVQGQ